MKLLLHSMPYEVRLFLIIVLFFHEYHSVIGICSKSYFNTTKIGLNLICLIFHWQYCQISFKSKQKWIWILFKFIQILFYNVGKYNFNFRCNLHQWWLNAAKYKIYFLYIRTSLSTELYWTINKNDLSWLKLAWILYSIKQK